MSESDEISTEPWIDPDDAPPWTAEIFARAAIHHGERLVRPATGTLTKDFLPEAGRPKSVSPKRQLTIRLDQAVLDYFRATGAGWQGRINDILRREAGI